MAQASGGLVESIVKLPGMFAEVASQSPEQALLLALGVVIFAFSAGVFGALTVGGIVDVIVDAIPTGSPPPQGR